jgi:hypothetical chaperone protein
MRLGVDFGTTHSAIALYDGDALIPIRVDAANDNPNMMPSLIYIDRAGMVTVGAAAAQKYLEQETGRPIRWRKRDVGEFETVIASFDVDPIEYQQTLSVMVDEGANGRLLQSLKRALFNDRYDGTTIFGRFYRIDELIAIILRHLKSAAETALKGPCRSIVLGRPVRFSHNPAADSRAEAILLKAAHVAGFDDVRFQLEPVGVAHLMHRSSADRQTALIFDFGGGTLDLTVARIGGGDLPRILATAGVLIGGDDLDRRIMEALLPHFGGGDEGLLSPEMSDKLLAWQTMPELSRPNHLEMIRRLAKTGDPRPYRALETLVTRNVGFKLFKEIERVKKLLSTEPAATLDFAYEAIQIQETISRRRFERLIAREVDEIEASIHRVVADAGCAVGDIDVVLRTGGSSLIPVFARLLTDIFGEDRQCAIDPLVSVVGGFAVAAYEYTVNPPPVIRPEDAIAAPGSVTGRAYALDTARLNGKVYTDRDFAITRLPSRLDGRPLIRTPNLDKDAHEEGFARFTLKRPARVWIAYDSAVQRPPDWVLRRFSPDNMQVEIDDDFALISRTMALYGGDFPAGELVLGGCHAPGLRGDAPFNYFVLVDSQA